MNAAHEPARKDLVALVADKNMEATIVSLLERPQALGIRPITYDVFVHPRRDPGCVTEADDFLRTFSSVYRYALVLFDHEGCGREQVPPEPLADEVKARLEEASWTTRAEAIVLAPELEVWAWSGSPHVARCLGWEDRKPPLRDWLAKRGFWQADAPKPHPPKAAFEAALREVHKPRSSAIYGELARSVSLARPYRTCLPSPDHYLAEMVRRTRNPQPITRNPS